MIPKPVGSNLGYGTTVSSRDYVTMFSGPTIVVIITFCLYSLWLLQLDTEILKIKHIFWEQLSRARLWFWASFSTNVQLGCSRYCIGSSEKIN